MALVSRKTPEQRQLEAQERQREAELREWQRREADQRRQAEERQERVAEARDVFFKTSVGRARVAYERGDHVFQCSLDVMDQQAIIVAMVGSTTSKKTADPADILNSVCHEGWDLVNGSFVFVEEGLQSRDKFMSSGQNGAIKGATVGYYLFKRCDANRREPTTPWEDVA